MPISRSSERGSFSRNVLVRKFESGMIGNEELESRMQIINDVDAKIRANEETDEFKVYNLEYDLRTCDWILDKVRNNDYYAQNLYAAICNNEFIRNDVWPLLKKKTWSCSWRYAGGIIADMRQEGDYIDWYCSGIKEDINPMDDDQYQNLSKEAQERYLQVVRYVSESVVTDEIREDLLKLGWVVSD